MSTDTRTRLKLRAAVLEALAEIGVTETRRIVEECMRIEAGTASSADWTGNRETSR